MPRGLHPLPASSRPQPCPLASFWVSSGKQLRWMGLEKPSPAGPAADAPTETPAPEGGRMTAHPPRPLDPRWRPAQPRLCPAPRATRVSCGCPWPSPWSTLPGPRDRLSVPRCQDPLRPPKLSVRVLTACAQPVALFGNGAPGDVVGEDEAVRGQGGPHLSRLWAQTHPERTPRGPWSQPRGQPAHTCRAPASDPERRDLVAEAQAAREAATEGRWLRFSSGISEIGD